MSFLAAPIILVLYLGYKVYTKTWSMYVKAHEMDLQTGIVLLDEEEPEEIKTWGSLPLRFLKGLF